MKIFILATFLLLASSFASAESKLDEELRSIGVIDHNYKIVDYKTFDEILRVATEQVAPMLPAKIDSVTTALNMSLNRFGIYSIYQIDGVETKEDAKSLMINQGLAENYKNYMCSLEYSQSLVFRNNGNMAANMSLVNSKYQILYSLRVPFTDCI
ncbi:MULTISPECIES: hypothetical protein [Acinetobacter]|uniref:hypothetical protein n=1 Tax=Acinetobacter TaxID=469 RepID=UPI0015D1E389|nr:MULTISPECIES: hypothetical protein [Acinetobacter]UIP24544.1 hypothetical protein LZG54_10360 [Acinetobacter towneri]